jgi:NAD(P)-dependent dehydrogenase (short-subunit alcohol dehydrogenase family)
MYVFRPFDFKNAAEPTILPADGDASPPQPARRRPMGKLSNKVAVITGGNSGIGLSTAKAFVDEGAKVVIFGRDQASLDRAVETLGSHALGVRGDVTSDADLATLFATATRAFGRVDALFVNAGVAEFVPVEGVTDAHFDRLFDINVKGVLKTVQKAIPALNDGAAIVLTTSGANEIGMPGGSVYGATKAAVRSFARTFSAELVHRGIRVNAVSPGPVATPIFGRMGMPEEQAQAVEAGLAAQVPLKRVAQPDEIARAVVFLASAESSYVVGAELVVDGGLTQL